jgi:hypothetical protein
LQPSFDSRIIINIAAGEGLIEPQTIQDRLKAAITAAGIAPSQIEYVVTPNAENHEAGPFFDELLPRIANTNECEFTFVGHTKGITHPGNLAVQLWTEWC